MSDYNDCFTVDREIISGNIFIRPLSFTKNGGRMEGHHHQFDHTTIVFNGRFHVTITDDSGAVLTDTILGAPTHLLIKAHLNHEFTCLSDSGLIWCVYSHRAPNGEVVQDYQKYGPSYA